jgi:hypothetical protein
MLMLFKRFLIDKSLHEHISVLFHIFLSLFISVLFHILHEHISVLFHIFLSFFFIPMYDLNATFGILIIQMHAIS